MTKLEPLAVDVNTACDLIGCKRSKFYELVKTGEIVVIKLGSKTLAPIDQLKALIARKIDEASKSGEAA